MIEILVAILIIGILAAIALPQYRLSVAKTKAAQGLAIINTLYQSLEAYYMTRGHYPNVECGGSGHCGQSQLNKLLDINIPIKSGLSIMTYSDYFIVANTSVLGSGSEDNVAITRFLKFNSRPDVWNKYVGKTMCSVIPTANDIPKKVCMNLCQTDTLKGLSTGNIGCLF